MAPLQATGGQRPARFLHVAYEVSTCNLRGLCGVATGFVRHRYGLSMEYASYGRGEKLVIRAACAQTE